MVELAAAARVAVAQKEVMRWLVQQWERQQEPMWKVLRGVQLRAQLRARLRWVQLRWVRFRRVR